MEKILITVDKSHIITIGERLYTEAIELIRELINNAYDADAEIVEVFVGDNIIRVQDNGIGMDMDGLKQYFNIGSPFKQWNKKTPRFGRERIGQFGIGKFASLAAASRFEIYTQKGKFSARVIFDKKEWEKNRTDWQLPLEIIPPNPQQKDGTTVTLHDVFKKFNLTEVEKRIQESVPLKAGHFVVKLNGHQIMAKKYEGQVLPILEGSAFGPIHGELVILPLSQASRDEMGIEIKVKQVTIKRELLGIEQWGEAGTRVRGEIHSDFLPITSDRSGFIEDTPEYVEFKRVIEKILGEVKKSLGKLEDKSEKKRASRALNEALERVYKALALNPDLSPFGAIPLGNPLGEGTKKGALPKNEKQESFLQPNLASETQGDTLKSDKDLPEIVIPKKLKKASPSLKKLSPDAVVKKLRLGKISISCCLDHFGPEASECRSEGTVIFINQDHSLYQKATKSASLYTMHIARLLTQEIALMKDHRSPRQSFRCQSKLLQDAFTH